MGEHALDTRGAARKIEYRLTPPKAPQINGMVERFNGRIEKLVLLSATSAVSTGQYVALAGDEGLAQIQTGAVQETAILSPGM